MPREENIKAVQHASERFSARDLEGYLKLYDPGVLLYGFGNVRMGVAGLREHFQQLLKGFPDMRIESHDIFGEGEKVAHRFSFCGTHKGEYLGIAPTNEFIFSPAVLIHLFEHGKCVEAWLFIDRSRFLALRERVLAERHSAQSSKL
jgi:predicted ester cyclase